MTNIQSKQKKKVFLLEENTLRFPHASTFLLFFTDLTRNIRTFLFRVNKTGRTGKARSICRVPKPQ